MAMRDIIIDQEKLDINKISPIRTSEQIDKMRIAGGICAKILNLIGEDVKPGITTKELDNLALKYIKGHGAELDREDLEGYNYGEDQAVFFTLNDVAARGIDVEDITHVINYQLPDEIETYTHRSGRTGRAGKTGVSMVIVSKSEKRKIQAIEKIIKKNFIAKDIPSGMEICEVQLFHLANNIKKTEINHDIDPYLPNINEVLEDFSKEELIKKVFSVEFTRFYNYYKKAKDLNLSPGDLKDNNDDTVRYFINIGRKDDFDWMSLKDFLKEVLQLGKDDLYKVDVKDSFSFFNTDTIIYNLYQSIFIFN